MEHKCTLPKDESSKLHHLDWLSKLRLISPHNPLGVSLFRSEISIREEQHRHLTTNKLAIHPYSKFKAWYEIYLIYLYFSVLMSKAMDSAFMNIHFVESKSFYGHYTILTDGFCWVDIVLNFFMGYEIPNSNAIELRAARIATHYLQGPFFVFDVVSSIPQRIMYYLPETDYRMTFISLVKISNLFKIVRLVSLVTCIRKSAEYFRVAAKGITFLVCCLIFSSVIVHWMACMQFIIPKLIRKSFTKGQEDDTWFNQGSMEDGVHLQKAPILSQYFHSFFRSSAYILGIRLEIYRFTQPEEYLLAIFTYLVGKIMVAFIWIILAVSILNSRHINIKYAEFINQLDEYMRQKQLPMPLRNRMRDYCRFKFRDRFFKEDVINSLFSESLRREANLHSCKNLIQSVSLFSELSPYEVSKVVGFLVPEIYMPNDAILYAGTHGDAMFFLSSGTVAVYTRSGKEVCHLQDGAYFGEVSLVMKGQFRIATVVALETTHVYRLHKKDFHRCLLTNKAVKAKILQMAEKKLKETLRIEEDYKQQELEHTLRLELAKPRKSKE